jgi:hypothetical protein
MFTTVLTPFPAWAWEEHRALDFIMAHNPLLRAYRVVTTEYTPPDSTWDRVLEYTSVYGRAKAGVFRPFAPLSAPPSHRDPVISKPGRASPRA